MTKTYDIIHLPDGYEYAVDKEAKLSENDYYTSHLNDVRKMEEINLWSFPLFKIIATNNKSLNLPLLPEIEENWFILAKKDWEKSKKIMQDMKESTTLEQQAFFFSGFSFGYKAANKKAYTEEDMRRAMSYFHILGDNEYDLLTEQDRVIKSLNPLPIAVELEMNLVDDNDYSDHEEGGTYPGKVISEYQPKVVNNIVQVKQWIYGK